MAMFAYLQLTQLLLNDVTMAKYNDGDLATYINLARSQIAGQGECVRNYSTLAVVSGVQQYAFSSISGLATGIASVLNIRQASYALASGQGRMHSRSFPDFNYYYLMNPVPIAGPPSVWSQFGQGVNGSIFINLPDQAYALSLDCVCVPNALSEATDTDVEALPYPWTDAVPFYACWYALMSMNMKDEADKKYQQFEQMMARARGMANSDVLPSSFLQSQDPFRASRLGLVAKNNA